MSDDIFQVKPSIGGVSINFNTIWKKFFAKSKFDPVAIVAKRFIELFGKHGVPITQIPRFLPEVAFEKLKSPDALLSILTSELIEKTANIFQVRRSWLDAIDDRIYEPLFCYKTPSHFFEELAKLRFDSSFFPFRALYSEELDNTNDSDQPVALILLEKVMDLNDEEICRYRVFNDEWSWGHWGCRLQLKAMVRLTNEILKKPVPLYKTKWAVLDAIRKGKMVPFKHLQGCRLTNPSLEDYSFSTEESAVSKEGEELPDVLDYIRDCKLDKVASVVNGATLS